MVRYGLAALFARQESPAPQPASREPTFGDYVFSWTPGRAAAAARISRHLRPTAGEPSVAKTTATNSFGLPSLRELLSGFGVSQTVTEDHKDGAPSSPKGNLWSELELESFLRQVYAVVKAGTVASSEDMWTSTGASFEGKTAEDLKNVGSQLSEFMDLGHFRKNGGYRIFKDPNGIKLLRGSGRIVFETVHALVEYIKEHYPDFPVEREASMSTEQVREFRLSLASYSSCAGDSAEDHIRGAQDPRGEHRGRYCESLFHYA